MTITKTIELAGKQLHVRKTHGGAAVVIMGEGAYASLSIAQAIALYAALRQLDEKGLLAS